VDWVNRIRKGNKTIKVNTTFEDDFGNKVHFPVTTIVIIEQVISG
jgi:hypothetical protein